MKWESIKSEPIKSGVYPISISIYKGNDQHFICAIMAHYDKISNKWYKYDPFENSSIGEEIKAEVLGWIDKFETFPGR
ncbi:MAG: hypothetical protein R2774_01945 [Saprospiraceae bacterium]